MTRIQLSIEPDLCGSISVGTVALIKLLAESFDLTLPRALDYVNRCVFDGEVVEVEAPSSSAAEDFAARVGALTSGAVVHVRIRPEA